MKTRNVPRPARLVIPPPVQETSASVMYYMDTDLETCEVLSPPFLGFPEPGPTSPAYTTSFETYYPEARAPSTFRAAGSHMSKRNWTNYFSFGTEWVMRNTQTKLGRKNTKSLSEKCKKSPTN
jgi:hypothetical protein